MLGIGADNVVIGTNHVRRMTIISPYLKTENIAAQHTANTFNILNSLPRKRSNHTGRIQTNLLITVHFIFVEKLYRKYTDKIKELH